MLTSRRPRLPQHRRRTIAVSLGAASLNADVTPSPLPSTLHHHFLNVDTVTSSPPSVQPPSMSGRRLPQRRCRAIAASLDATPSPPSMPVLHHRRLPRCSLSGRRIVASWTSSWTLSTLLCSVQSAGIVLSVIALFIGLINSMMICGVVRLEHDSLRVLVS
jgi:hypothetical protein